MSTVAINPIEYLRKHIDHAHIAKTVLRLVLAIGFMLFMVGGLYSTLANINTAKRDVVVQTYTYAFPSSMPNVVIYPLVYSPFVLNTF